MFKIFFLTGCGYGLDCAGKYVLTNTNPEVDGTYWLSQYRFGASEPSDYPHIILDLNCVTMVKGVEFVNNHLHVSTKSFSIWVATSHNGPWIQGTEVTDLENTDIFTWTGPLPLPVQTFLFDSPIRARFVKLKLLDTHYGDTFAGVQYLNPITGRTILFHNSQIILSFTHLQRNHDCSTGK